MELLLIQMGTMTKLFNRITHLLIVLRLCLFVTTAILFMTLYQQKWFHLVLSVIFWVILAISYWHLHRLHLFVKQEEENLNAKEKAWQEQLDK